MKKLRFSILISVIGLYTLDLKIHPIVVLFPIGIIEKLCIETEKYSRGKTFNKFTFKQCWEKLESKLY